MRPIYPLAAGAMLAACLAGWVALAWGQPGFAKLPDDKPALKVVVAGEPVQMPPLTGVAGEAPAPLPPMVKAPVGELPPMSVPPLPEMRPTVLPAAAFEPAVPPSVKPAVPDFAPQAPSATPPPMMPPVAQQSIELPSPKAPPAQSLLLAPPPPTESVQQPTPPPPAVMPKVPEVKAPTAVDETAVGKQEPLVTVEWVGPPMPKIGVPTEYILVVRNTGGVAVRDVKVNVSMPMGMRFADSTGSWSFGLLEAKQEKTATMKLVAETHGDLVPQATVHFASVAAVRIKVREPKLIVKTTVADKTKLGEPATFTITVNNPGDGAAEKVRIQTTLSEGLTHERGQKVDFDLGNLGAGETRSVTLNSQTKASGPQSCKTLAIAEDDLTSTDTARVTVVAPRLDLQVAGPGLRYLERKALYTLKVTNTGDALANNVTVADVVPAGFKVLAASNDGRHDSSTRTVSWTVGELEPGQMKEVQLEVQAVNPGHHVQKAVASGTNNVRTEGELATNIEGLSAISVELVDTEDPVEVNGETAYEIRLTNTGSKTDSNLKLVAEVPAEMQFKSATGPTRFTPEGNKVVFEPLEKLSPRAEALYRINVKALKPGTVRFKISVTGASLVEPVVQMEATRIYADTPAVKTAP